MLIRDPVDLHLVSSNIKQNFFRFLKHLNDLEHPPVIYQITYHFVYHINTIALYRQKKPTLLMNENKEIDNSRIKIAQWVGAKAQGGKMR